MHFYPPMLTDDHRRTRTERDRRWRDDSVSLSARFLSTDLQFINKFSICLHTAFSKVFVVLYNKSVNEWSPGKQLTLRFSGNKINSVFHPRPVIKCLKELRHGLCILKNLA